ncbi:hypothetical protein AZI86_08195 [Bdellovibrio bacteriovorus]|uniref:Glutamine amidotransferase n=1 Tax=Bdellovibrio bacteriovorus TaxID=959 RepID=A0A150WR70_BDEBC|nr:hypothetical protein AZI86_08195 [Bdellovibrio bacteriovorus]
MALADVTLYAWERGHKAPAIIIPVREGQSPLEVWESYVENLKTHADLNSFTPPADLEKPTEQSFKKLSYEPEKHSLLLANTKNDLSPAQTRPTNWTKLMLDRGIKNFVLPPAVGSVLSKNHRDLFHKEVAAHFSILFPLGGADVDPHIYGDIPNGARGYNGVLDIYEKELIQKYIQSEKGFVYATCRGAQMTAASMGYKIVQDVPSQVKTAHEHWDVGHDVIIDSKNELMAKIWKGLEKIFIYSYHHQAIDYKPIGPLTLAGVAADGIPEILVFKNGRGLLMQGHPELTLGGRQNIGDLDAARKLFDGFVLEARNKVRFTCGKILL